jgi:hypothetical protein
MSKLIVEMETPQGCPCELATEIEGYFYPCFAYYGVVERAVEFDECMRNGTRPDWCPIKGALPDEHGDLIDRDALRKSGMKYRDGIDENGLIYVSLRDVMKSISNASVIIAAERKI